jgi:acyl-CoA synthetase (AMP-forming)/AMP-acid ligase II
VELQDYPTFVHACLYIATPFALISASSTSFELKHSIKLSKANWLFIDEKLLSTVLPIARELGIPSKKILTMSGHVSGRRNFSRLVDEMEIQKPDLIPVRSVRKDTLAYLVFSSGTTGLPKGTVLEINIRDSGFTDKLAESRDDITRKYHLCHSSIFNPNKDRATVDASKYLSGQAQDSGLTRDSHQSFKRRMASPGT